MSRPCVLLNISGPYGVGKDTLLNYIMQWQAARVHRASTITTRPSSLDADPSYRSVSRRELEHITSSGNWIITHQLDGQVLYATSLEEIDAVATRGQVSILSVYPSDQGAGSLRRAYGNRLYSLGVLASVGDHDSQISVLRSRLLSRGRDDREVIDARLRYQAEAIDYILRNPVVSTSDGPMQVFDDILINSDVTGSKDAIRELWIERIKPTLEDDLPKSHHEILASCNERIDVGGAYFNPVSALESWARLSLLMT